MSFDPMPTLQRWGNWGSGRIKCFGQEPSGGWKQAKTRFQILWFPGSGALCLHHLVTHPRLHHLSLSCTHSKATPVSLAVCSGSSLLERKEDFLTHPYIYHHVFRSLSTHSVGASLAGRPLFLVSGNPISFTVWLFFWPNSVLAFNQMHPSSTQSKSVEEPVRKVVSSPYVIFWCFQASLKIWMPSLWNKCQSHQWSHDGQRQSPVLSW